MDFFANNVCVRQDANGNIAPDKAKSREKIDGIAATVNALAIAMTAEAEMPADSWNIVVL
jgi:phage terminase large subunit-like protein